MRNPPRAVMIFAAGLGTRMLPLTADRPKPLVEVAGKALIDHALDLTRDIRPDRIVANLHYKADMLAQHLAPLSVDTITETPRILDTGGGLRHALPLLGEGPVYTLNPDAIWRGPNPLDLLRTAWAPDEMDGLLCLVPVAQTTGYKGDGDFSLDDANRLSRGPGCVYGGAQIVRTDRLHEIAQEAFSLNNLWDMLATEGRLFGCVYPGKWCDVGHPGGIALAEDLLAQGSV